MCRRVIIDKNVGSVVKKQKKKFVNKLGEYGFINSSGRGKFNMHPCVPRMPLFFDDFCTSWCSKVQDW